MRSYHTLRDLFHAIATLTLATAAASAADGCGGSTATDTPGTSADGGGGSDGGGAGDAAKDSGDGGGGIDRGPFTTNVCTGTQYEPLEGVTLAPTKKPIDYLEIRYEQEDFQRTDGGPIDPTRAVVNVSAKRGTACSTATDPTTCNATLQGLRTQAGWRPASAGLVPPRFKYLVYTSGDDVVAVTSLADLRALIAPAETAKDAALLATATDEYYIVCDGRNNARQTTSGWDIVAQSGSTCGAGTHLDESVLAVASASGTVTVSSSVRLKDGDPNCAVGRRPAGLARPERAEASLGGWLAEIAHLEAAAITAFERLAGDLAAHGAPGRLVRAALAGRDDEVRHARIMGDLARERGGSPAEVVVAPAAERSLFAIALENAVEGCVRETFAALVAMHQAERAESPAIRATMRAIAADEIGHGELAWAIHRWALTQLDAPRADALRQAMRDAGAELASGAATAPIGAPARRALGLPDPSVGVALASASARALWS